jgi:hypothetical protein
LPEYYNPHRLFTGSFVPNWLMLRTEVSPGAKLCFARLCQFAGEKGHCWPAQETLARSLGVGARQVRRYLKELEGVGLIAVTPGAGRESSRYRFPRHPWMAEDAPPPPRRASPSETSRPSPCQSAREPPSPRHLPESGKPSRAAARSTPETRRPPESRSRGRTDVSTQGGRICPPRPDGSVHAGWSDVSGLIKEEENQGRESGKEEDALAVLVSRFPVDQRDRLRRLLAAKAKRFGLDRLARNLEYALHRKPDDPVPYLAKAIDRDYADGWTPPPPPRPSAPPPLPEIPNPADSHLHRIDFAEARRKIREGRAREAEGKGTGG